MSKQPTIREMIAVKSEALREVDALGPVKAAEELVALASLLSSLNKYIAEKQYWLNVLKAKVYQEMEKKNATAAKIIAEASNEWKEWNEATQQGKALEELIRSVKYYLRAMGEEYKLQ